MSSQSFLEKCKTFFDQANGGQPLTIVALCRAIRKASPNFKASDAEIAEMFFDFDTDGDKLISWEEFEAAVTARDPKEVTRAELQTLFKSLDKDNSGKLNKEEIRRLCQQNKVKVSDQRLDAIIAEADHNHDGEVSYDEFLDAWFAEK